MPLRGVHGGREAVAGPHYADVVAAEEEAKRSDESREASRAGHERGPSASPRVTWLVNSPGQMWRPAGLAASQASSSTGNACPARAIGQYSCGAR